MIDTGERNRQLTGRGRQQCYSQHNVKITIPRCILEKPTIVAASTLFALLLCTRYTGTLFRSTKKKVALLPVPHKGCMHSTFVFFYPISHSLGGAFRRSDHRSALPNTQPLTDPAQRHNTIINRHCGCEWSRTTLACRTMGVTRRSWPVAPWCTRAGIVEPSARQDDRLALPYISVPQSYNNSTV